ncbi:GNAT domain-containing protein [Microdochium trichocladiopsis]|uniref:GNAT domain-containing protein n=1 Tax=Microdochium trichocladiopsis TaxID=1682393 RepID=A0A9P8Y6Y9_9PEZI|nr:GNAT domain-containing protein [Microdochium trichocladiopsis]KAH7029286.1 GNAT domain-containing protein [Microdochium trichocladiopsis]
MVLVRTSFPPCPLPPNAQRPPIKTKRLILRPIIESDLEGMHRLRTQPEAMTGTSRGVPDTSMDETRKAMEFFLPPNDGVQYLFGIFWQATGELIGEGGIHNLESGSSGWPEIGYKLRKEFWGQGVGTEFLRAFVASWWALPGREPIVRRVHRDSCTEEPVDVVEHVYANTDWDNIGSQKVMEKVGFVKFTEWTEPETRLNLQGQTSRLFGYRLARPVTPVA